MRYSGTVALLGAGVILSGCATTPYAAMSDFTDNKAEVRVAYDLFGPSSEAAKAAADPVGAEHCGSLKKTTTFISARRQPHTDYEGDYIFLYRCEGADRVIVE